MCCINQFKIIEKSAKSGYDESSNTIIKPRKGEFKMSVARLSSRKHPLFQLFSQIDKLVWRFAVTHTCRRGRPQKFIDFEVFRLSGILSHSMFSRIRMETFARPLDEKNGSIAR
jgi:hypothetical protein